MTKLYILYCDIFTLYYLKNSFYPEHQIRFNKCKRIRLTTRIHILKHMNRKLRNQDRSKTTNKELNDIKEGNLLL